MATIGKILVTILFVSLLLWVTLSNSAQVDFSAPPFFNTMLLPSPIIILVSVIAGFIWGSAIVWLNGSGVRGDVRRLKREIKMLEQEISKKV